MQGTEMVQGELRRLLEVCPKCCAQFCENVALIAQDDAGFLTMAQMEAVLVVLLDLHARH